MESRMITINATLRISVAIPTVWMTQAVLVPCTIVDGSRAMALIYVKQGSGLGRLSDSRRNAEPLGKGHKFRQGPNLHFLHHHVTIGLDGTFGTA
jgi:hypothetical protein